MADPVLYSFRRCPYAMRARFALVVSGQRCELREVLLRDKPPELLAASPKGTVPVLVDVDGTVIDQSLDIMRWTLLRRDPARWMQPERGSVDDMLALIAACDGDFKQQLDRYKYPNRFEGADAAAHRLNGAHFLEDLNERLARTSHLFGNRPALADMAIAPFVRQFAQTDIGWFELQPWPALRAWLGALVESAVWVSATHKYPAWKSGEAGVAFPPA
ncbi:glutathione S-transferase [Variovorax sp. J22G21]|uniref:glutathione S-transferase n=2 Tax=Variovorax fucosicus TaxID=3053517 RepID=UPI002574A7DB|nr:MULTISPECIES: glutathione S-transferase [unclassified Variovorax]MDM0039851.1 glutathione S-transferase [Variovorax sp. J22R193]MDM0064600.1 glutathione S-transferase [Variovorax sp. J22G21]